MEDVVVSLEAYDWDEGNILKNWQKHQVSKIEIEEVFGNKPIIFFTKGIYEKEEIRYGVYGKTNKQRLLAVVFTIRDKLVRPISARDQNRREKQYYQSFEK